MTDATDAGGGDSELAAPVDDPSNGADDGTTGTTEAAGATRTVPWAGNGLLVLGAILVIVIAQLVLTFLVLSSTNEVRDQYTAANGLQRCLIRAQLNENQTTDPSGTVYKAAVNSCLK